jgi:hypothetical protein
MRRHGRVRVKRCIALVAEVLLADLAAQLRELLLTEGTQPAFILQLEEHFAFLRSLIVILCGHQVASWQRRLVPRYFSTPRGACPVFSLTRAAVCWHEWLLMVSVLCVLLIRRLPPSTVFVVCCDFSVFVATNTVRHEL